MEIVDIFTRLLSWNISVWILRTVIVPSAQARPGPSQTIKSNVFARIVKVFKLMLLTVFVKSTIMDVWTALKTPLNCSNACN